jgi:hypothetical protein
MEEMVQSFFEDGVLQRNGVVKLVKSMSALKVPATVQGILASRIDHLPAEEKELLQTLAGPNCGSGVIAEADVIPDVTVVLAGTLDDPAAFKPTMGLYWSSVQPWVHTGGARTRFPKMPT